MVFDGVGIVFLMIFLIVNVFATVKPSRTLFLAAAWIGVLISILFFISGCLGNPTLSIAHVAFAIIFTAVDFAIAHNYKRINLQGVSAEKVRPSK
jgi:hypothetical protein